MRAYAYPAFPKKRKAAKKKPRVVVAPKRKVKRKAKRRVIQAVPAVRVPVFQEASPAQGFALIHMDGTISLASVRSNRAMVESLAERFIVKGYRVGNVHVSELT